MEDQGLSVFERQKLGWLKIKRLANLILVLMLIFFIAGITLLTVGAGKAASDCPDDQGRGALLVVLGSIATAIAATLGVLEAAAVKYKKILEEEGAFG